MSLVNHQETRVQILPQKPYVLRGGTQRCVLIINDREIKNIPFPSHFPILYMRQIWQC